MIIYFFIVRSKSKVDIENENFAPKMKVNNLKKYSL